MKLLENQGSAFVLKAVNKENAAEFVLQEANVITENVTTNEAFIFLPKGLNNESVKSFARMIAGQKREFAIDVTSFVNDDLTEETLISELVKADEYVNGEIFNQKTNKKAGVRHGLLNVSEAGKEFHSRTLVFAEAETFVRDLQTTSPNILNSETMAAKIVENFKGIDGLSVKVIGKKEIEELGMGLFLSVNRASAFEAQLVVVEYNGAPSSNEKTVLVGKGIMFDSGGYNIKTGRFMTGMKFDMSGAAIVGATVKVAAQLKANTNVAAVLPLTDNVIAADASRPDTVWTAMNGKTVEINNTDAEGRLVLADAITYAAKNLNATRIADVATLTGAVISALGDTYTGVWSSTDEAWADVQSAAKKANEPVWRMPLHSDYLKFMKGSKVADLFNTDLSGKAGSSSAAMFLMEFNEGVEHVHFDIAATADTNHVAQAPIIRTLFELANSK